MDDQDSNDVFLDPIPPTKGPAKVAKLVKVYDAQSKRKCKSKHLPSPETGECVNPKKSSKSIEQRLEQDDSYATTIVKCTRAVVIDAGTGYLKAGFAGNQTPSCVIPSVVGTRRGPFDYKRGYVGRDALDTTDIFTVNPVHNGIITDWEAMEKLWEGAFLALNISCEEHAILLCDPPLSPTTNREKFAEIMFETFSIPAMYIENQSLLSIYSYGRTTGLVLECGHGCSYVVPIDGGYCMPSNVCRADYAGHSLDEYLIQLLKDSGKTIPSQPFGIVEDIKAKCCYTATDLDHELSLKENAEMEYTLPDGTSISIGKERFLCPEALFQPSALGSHEPGLHTMVMNSINKCDINLKNDMLRNILVCGGSTMFRGFPERLQSELNNIAACAGTTTVAASEERKNAVWLGGSILASLSSFQSLWIRRRDYQEKGPFAIYRKFL